MRIAPPHRRPVQAFAEALQTRRAGNMLTVAAAGLAAVALLTFLLSMPSRALGKQDTRPTPAVGETAPQVVLADQDGNPTALADLWSEKPLVVYFYPKDFTPGCTAQACSLRDANREMRSAGLHVVGISFDSVESHRKFADKHGLPFTLLADPEGEAARAFGVAGSFFGVDIARRVTFLIGRDGQVRRVWDPAGTSNHAEQVLEGARELGLLTER